MYSGINFAIHGNLIFFYRKIFIDSFDSNFKSNEQNENIKENKDLEKNFVCA